MANWWDAAPRVDEAPAAPVPQPQARPWWEDAPVVPQPRPEPSSRAEDLDQFYGSTSVLDRIVNPFKAGVASVRQGMQGLGVDVATRAEERLNRPPEQLGVSAFDRAQARLTPAELEEARSRAGEAASGSAQRIATLEAERRAIPQNPAVGRMMQARTVGEAFKAFWEDPAGVVLSIGSQSLPAMLPGMAAAAVTGPVGGAAAMGGSSFASEYASSVLEGLADAGVDLENAEAVRDAFRDPKLVAALRERAAIRGGIIGAFDAASMGLASKTLVPGRIADRFAREAANVPAQMTAQAGAGAAGEAAAQLATEGEIAQPGQVLAEAVGESFTAPLDVTALAASRQMPQTARPVSVPQPIRPVAPPSPARPTAPPQPTQSLPAPRPVGARQQASAQPLPPPTPADVASPIPTDLIQAGRAEIRDSMATMQANEATRAQRLPPVGSRVAVADVTGELVDASADGITVMLDNGARLDATFDELRGAGLTVTEAPEQEDAEPRQGRQAGERVTQQPAEVTEDERSRDEGRKEEAQAQEGREGLGDRDEGRLGLTAAPSPGVEPARPAPAAAPASTIVPVDPREIETDAKTFQYKGDADKSGVTDRLAGVETFDPVKAGIALVFERSDGRRVIADGHQRLALAKRVAARGGDATLNAVVFREADGFTPAQVRTIAALKNIAEGTGTTIDAAKVLRDSPESAAELPPRSTLVRQARALAALSDDAFGAVINEVVPPSYGAIVGDLVPAPLQRDVIGLLAKVEPQNATQAEAVVRQALSAGATKSTQETLFGTEQVAASLYGERARVLDGTLKQLARDRQVFGTLAREAERIERAGNVLSRQANEERAGVDSRAIEYLKRLANSTGPVSDSLNEAARQLRETGKLGQAVQRVVDAVRGLERGGDGGSRVEPSGSDRAARGADDRRPQASPADARADLGRIAVVEEPGAEGLPQTVLPGAEKSAKQAQAARAAAGRKKPNARQRSDDKALSAKPDKTEQRDIEDLTGKASVAQSPPARGRASPPDAQRDAIVKELRDILRRVAGPRVRLGVSGELRGPSGQPIAGNYLAGVVRIALSDYAGGSLPLEELGRVTRHEAIHFLREAGAFSASEWRMLEARAKSEWREKFDIDQRYGGMGLTEADLNEEAVADAFAAWQQGRLPRRGEIQVRGVFGRVRDIIAAIRDAVRRLLGRPPTSDDARQIIDLFESVERGDVADRLSDVVSIDELLARDDPPPKFAMPMGSGQQNAQAIAAAVAQTQAPLPQGQVGSVAPDETWADKARVIFQDRFLPVRRVQEKVEALLGRPLTEDEQPYMAEELFHGRIGEKKFRVDKDFREPIVDLMAKGGHTLVEVDRFLMARHAQERNEQIASINPKLPDGGSGMTTADANAILNTATPELREIGRLVDAMMNQRLDELVDSGLMSDQSAQTLRELYPHYVPLRGVPDADPDVEAMLAGPSGRGYMGRRSVEKRATGRFTEAPDVLATAFVLADEAIVRGEKNRVAQKILALAQQARDPKVWEINPAPIKARIGKNGKVEYRKEPRYRAEDTVSVRVSGKERRIQIKNKMLRDAIRGLQGTDGGVVETVAKVTRQLSRLNTSLNPEFVITNAFMDGIAGLINLGKVDVPGARAAVLKNYRKSLLGYHHYITTGKTNTPFSKWAQEFRQAGGQTVFNQLTDIETQVRGLTKELRSLQGGSAINPLSAIKRAADAIENVNSAIDSAIRLSTFVTLRQRGFSPARAASVAKNLTVNFNRKGQAGPALNALFMFYNASVQGTAVIVAAMKHPNVRRAVYAIAALGVLQEMLGMMWGGDDEERDDKTGLGLSAYDKIPEWVKTRNIILQYGPGDADYLMIRMPYGYNFFHNIGRISTAYLRGARNLDGQKMSLADVVANLYGSFNDAVAPAGLSQTIPLVPTVALPIAETMTNRNYFGAPISPERFPGDRRPDSQLASPSVSPMARDVAQMLNRITGGDEFQSGLIDIAPGSIEHVLKTYGGAASAFVMRTIAAADKGLGEALGTNLEDPELTAGDLPFVRRVIGGSSPYQVIDATYRRITRLQVLKDRLKAASEGPTADPEKARKIRDENRYLVPLIEDGVKLHRQLSKWRKERRAILADDSLSAAAKRAKTDALTEAQQNAMRTFNQRFMAAQRAQERASR